MNNHWEAKYQWIRDPNELPNNRITAFGMLKKTEKGLSRNPKHAKTYSLQIQDMVERGVARKLSQAELDTYEGPTFYLSHHEVLKPGFESTPRRIVFN